MSSSFTNNDSGKYDIGFHLSKSEDTSAIEKLKIAAGGIAELLWLVYSNCVSVGFNEEQAFDFAKSYVLITLSAAPESDSNLE